MRAGSVSADADRSPSATGAGDGSCEIAAGRPPPQAASTTMPAAPGRSHPIPMDFLVCMRCLPLPAVRRSPLPSCVSARTKPVLLVSDIHLGATPPDHRRAFGTWLDYAAGEASSLIINGDLFDFWFEYHWGITRGHDEILARLREIVDSGVPITLMGGNHDWWGGRYLTDEIGLEFLRAPVTRDHRGTQDLPRAR